MEDKIEIQNALRLARDIITRERLAVQPTTFQPQGMENEPAPIADPTLAVEVIRRRGLEVVRRLR